MPDYKDIVANVLRRINSEGAISLNEGNDVTEKMHPSLAKQLKERKHSLGDHPIFPTGDETSFEEKIMKERFDDVVNTYKRHHDVERINNGDVIMEMGKSVMECMEIEEKHKEQLVEMAIKMVRDEFDIGEDEVDIVAELTSDINMEGTQKNPSPVLVEMEFEDHDSQALANDEVYKRRFLNAMIQGSAKKSGHMFHMVADDLAEMDSRLPTKYSKMLSAADYAYYMVDEQHAGLHATGAKAGGVARVDFPEEGGKPTIYVQAMVFPILIHELVKGVMEILSSHGLPEDDGMRNYVVNKADFLNAEPWDMRLGPALWNKFTNTIEPEDFHLKHHVYHEMAALPVHEFNDKMREVMAGTKRGKSIITDMITEIKREMTHDDFEASLSERRDNFNGEMGLDDLDNIDLSDLGF